jgi:hypothetical protein
LKFLKKPRIKQQQYYHQFCQQDNQPKIIYTPHFAAKVRIYSSLLHSTSSPRSFPTPHSSATGRGENYSAPFSNSSGFSYYIGPSETLPVDPKSIYSNTIINNRERFLTEILK